MDSRPAGAGVLLVLVLLGALVAAPSASADLGALTWQGCFTNPASATTCAGSNSGLAGPRSVAVSPDGKSVYVTGYIDNRVSMFQRDTTTGALTPQGCIADADVVMSPCDDFVEGLANPVGIAISPNGDDVYVGSEGDDAVAHLERNTSTGELTGIGCIANTGDVASCGGSTQGGLFQARSVVMAPDGTAVYVVGGNTNEGALTRLTRNTGTGALGPGDCIEITGGIAGCTLSRDGLDDLYDLAISPDGTSLHAVTRDSDAVFSFTTPGFGFLGCSVDDDEADISGCADTEGLAGARGVAASPDGKSVYVVSGANSAIARFDRGPTGVLTAAGCIGDPDVATGCPATQQGLNLGADVAVSSDNASVYAGSETDDAIVRFDRDPATGALTGRGCIEQSPAGAGCAADFPGLHDPLGVTVSPDARSVYVAASAAYAISRFDREIPGGSSPPPGGGGDGGGTTPPSNDVRFRTTTATCRGSCKTIKVKLTFPPKNPGRAALCTPPGTVAGVTRLCPRASDSAAASRHGAFASAKKVRKLIVTKSFNVKGGPVTVKLKLTKRARAILKRKHKLKLKLQVDFKPTSGTTNSKRKTITVKRRGRD